MIAEEFFLKERFGGEFEKWADQTPALLPKVSLAWWVYLIGGILTYLTLRTLKRRTTLLEVSDR